MFSFLRVLGERLRGVVADAGLDFEAQLVSRDAERKAVLLRKAARYEEEGLQSVARELRQRAEAMSFSRLLASVTLPAPPTGAVAGNGQALAPARRGR